ncbi:MAG TPA: FHA domain-containing protein [Acidobacteria bacterium]|nr:FHA domain-containing protein [Acidobacteriota bacterium]
MYDLVYEDGGINHRVRIHPGLSLGRASDNDVILRDFSVSRHHARIEGEENAPVIVDLGSTNGVKLNGEFIESAALGPGDLLTVGSFELRVEDRSTADEALSSATYLRPLAEFKKDYDLEAAPSDAARSGGERERVFEVLAQVAKVLLQVEELHPVLEKVMDLVFAHLKVDRGFIVLYDEVGGEPRLELWRARKLEDGEEPEVPISRTILDMVTSKKVALLTHDAQADQRFEAGRSIRIHQIRSAMCVPLWHLDQVIGVIYVDSPLHVGSFSTGDLDLLTALANYAAIAIEQARLRERIKSEQLVRQRLERYHSPAVIEAVLSGPEHGTPPVMSRETSILFADIVGFTSRCESLPPEEVSAFLNQFFSLAAEAIFQYGGTLDKFIGDAVMAFFGAPLPQPDHAERAVRAAIALSRALSEWNRERSLEGLEPVEVRTAIHSGPVVVGDIGSATRVDYTGLGNTVNVAARLEEFVATPGLIVLGETTQAAVAHIFPTEHLGNVQLKGLTRKIAAYRVKLEEISHINGGGA